MNDFPPVTLPKTRAKERVGRNDPCPCGSGRKYKKCCEGREREGEVYVEVLSAATIRKLGPDEIDELRFRAEELDDSALEALLIKMFQFRMYDNLITTLGYLPYRESFDRFILALMEMYLFMEDTDRLKRVRAIHEYEDDELPTLVQLQDAVDEDFDALPALERYAVERLAKPSVSDVGTVLLNAGFPALATLIYRGAFAVAVGVACEDIDQASPKTGALMNFMERKLSSCLEAAGRDPDPFRDIIGAALDAVMAVADSRFMQRFNATRQDDVMHEMRAEIDTLRSQIETRPTEPKPKTKTEPPKPKADQSETRDLRDKLKRVETMLKERNEERRTLRTKLDEAEAKITELEAAASAQDEEDDEDDLEDQHLGTQPPRLPVLSAEFKDSVSKIPAPVFATAMKVIGRLAAGHEPTFRQATRTKLDRDAWRYRIGVYRLMFTVNGSIEIHDIIHRRELERWLHKHYHKR